MSRYVVNKILSQHDQYFHLFAGFITCPVLKELKAAYIVFTPLLSSTALGLGVGDWPKFSQ